MGGDTTSERPGPRHTVHIRDLGNECKGVSEVLQTQGVYGVSVVFVPCRFGVW